MDDREVVTVFVRHAGEILLLRRSAAVGSYPGRWGTVAGHAEGDPEGAIAWELREEIGREDWTLVRRGAPHTVADRDLGVRWRVHPALVEVPDRAIDLDREHAIAEWVHPPAIRRRPTVPRLWRSYDRVRPTVATVATDSTHGSREVSLRALEALRDAAAATGRDGPPDLSALLATAADLATARPSMAAVSTRIDRAVTRGLRAGTPTGIERAAIAVHDEVRDARERVARHACPWIDDRHVLTLSRSGTVRAALERSDPEAVTVAVSRPGGEGLAVAAALEAAGIETTLVPDAAIAPALREVDTLLLGADSVGPDGTVLNKVGSRGAALAAAHEGVDVVVLTAADAVDPAGDRMTETGRVDDPVPDAPVPVETDSPLFDRVPPATIDRIVIETGAIDPRAVESLAATRCGRSRWRQIGPELS